MITSAGTVKQSSGVTVRLGQNTDCTTEKVVYLISCSSCNKQYVGETEGPLNKRMIAIVMTGDTVGLKDHQQQNIFTLQIMTS